MKMRSLLTAVLIIMLGAFAPASFAQQDISGTWQGKLQIAPGNELNIQFVLKKQADGTYAVTVNSPNNDSIKNLPASKVQFAANKLSFAVDALSGSYEGTWDKNTFTGKWHQPGSDLPLNLKPKGEMSQADTKKLLGSWVGKLLPPGGAVINLVLKIEAGANGKITGGLGNPDSGPNTVPVTDIELEDGIFAFRIPSRQATYSASFKDGKMEGFWSQAGVKLPFNLSKGEYVAAPAVVKLPDETKRLLNGEWVGAIKTPQATVTLVLRFSSAAGGAFKGAIVAPESSPAELPIPEMVQTDKTLLFKLPVMGAEYSAELKKDGSIDLIEGTWKQGGQALPLIMKKGKYIAPPPPTLALSAEAMRALKGTWHGKLDNNMSIRFETTAKGEHQGFLNNPDLGIKDLPINEATFAGGKLTFRIIRAGIEYTGDLAGNKLTGQWSRAGAARPLVLTRE